MPCRKQSIYKGKRLSGRRRGSCISLNPQGAWMNQKYLQIQSPYVTVAKENKTKTPEVVRHDETLIFSNYISRRTDYMQRVIFL